MTLAERVGQLFMAGADSGGVTEATLSAVRDDHVGSIIITTTNTLSASATKQLVSQVQAVLGASDPGLFVATDQEGGQVQRMQGPDFSSIPPALDQGRLSPSTLQNSAATWAQELASAGINLDLAPVVDTVPSAQVAPNNAPVGALQREFGFDVDTVATHGVAFVRGMASVHVATSAKHFPGLGRAVGNTDYTGGVADEVTQRHDPYLQPFAAAIGAGVPFVMMSTAYYPRIDPNNPAAFSSTVINTMLRGDLKFTGVVISDDIGAAAQVAGVAPADRAVKFLAAGGDMVLTVVPDQIPAMAAAVIARASSDAAFRAHVNEAALRVLKAKQRFGVLA